MKDARKSHVLADPSPRPAAAERGPGVGRTEAARSASGLHDDCAGATPLSPPPARVGEGTPPPAGLRDAVVRGGLAGAEEPWLAMQGGRSNLVWRIAPTRCAETGGAPPSEVPAGDTDRCGTRKEPGALVCKLYRPGAATPLFPNLPREEARALEALSGSGIAPELVAQFETPEGACLVYRHLPGAAGGAGPAETGAALARLHRRAPPPGLRQAAGTAEGLLDEAEAMLDALPGDLPRAHRGLRPAAPVGWTGGPEVFLHGDPVPANVVLSEEDGQARLIDWQCPARGDAVLDLALALSPAMRISCGTRPYAPEEARALLAAYGDPAAEARFFALAPVLAWRMGAYCLWKQESGDAAYGAAYAAEMAALAGMTR